MILVDGRFHRKDVVCSASTFSVAFSSESGRQTQALARFRTAEAGHPIAIVDGSGEVAEWLKAPVSKTGICIRISRVRIPPSSPYKRRYWPVASQYRIGERTGTHGAANRGEVPERLNGHAWKACVGASSPQVRILSSPPFFLMDIFILDSENAA